MSSTQTFVIVFAGLLALAAIMGGLFGKYGTMTRRPPRIEIVPGDITTQHVDAIVNAAKSSLLGGSGVDGAIHAAGGPAILRECRALRAMEHPRGLTAGDAVSTTAGELPAKWVIHTVGPRYDRHAEGDQAAILRACYARSLAIADQLGAKSIAFPLISAGVYGWPVGDAVRQALAALAASKTNVELIRLVLFDQDAFDMGVAALRTLGAK